MKMRSDIAAAAFAIVLVGSAAFAAIPAAHSQSRTQAAQDKSAPPSDDAPLTRDQVLKQGPVALEQNCTKCHQSDKWEGTNRDRDGWAAIVNEMSRQMAQAQMPPMSEKTTNLIIDYLTLTHPQ